MKIIRILSLSFCIIMMLSQTIFAIGTILDRGQLWTDTGVKHTNVTMDTGELKDASDEIYSLLLTLAIATAVIVGTILGVQYMTAGIDKKVEVKESLVPYIVSCIVVFGSFGIWKLVVTILKQI